MCQILSKNWIIPMGECFFRGGIGIMIRIAICDDEEIVCSNLEKNIVNACVFLHIECEVDIYDSGEAIINKLSADNKYNLFFLDIEMKKINGIDVSNYIRNKLNDESAQIIFVSGKNGYDRQLFAFRPFAFVEKPFDQDTIISTVEKYMRIYGNKNDLFHYKYGRDIYWAKMSNILYFKSNRRKIKIKCLTEEDEFYSSIEKVKEQVQGQGFISPHKSYLVNYRFIRSFQPDVIVMTNGEKIPIAKAKRNEIAKLQISFEIGGDGNDS